MGTLVKMRTKDQHEAIETLAKDLGWNQKRLEGFCWGVCGQPTPRTDSASKKVYQGMERLVWKLMTRQHWEAFDRLTDTLMTIRYEMNEWEQKFLPDIVRRRNGGLFVSPAMIKKTREIAHKYSVECGFPRLRELAAEADKKREQEYTSRLKKQINQ